MDASDETKRAAQRGPQGKRRIARTVVTSCVLLITVVGAVEAALRFGVGLGNPVLIAPDPACSYILKPDQDVVRFFVRTHINHYGMRSDDVPASRKPGTLRLLFVGDSITYGTTRVDQKAIFTELLHRDLPAIVHRPVEVLNASASAWAPDNELAFLQSRGIFHSDIVLLVLNDGDLTQPRSTIEDVGDNLPMKRPATAVGELYARYIRPRMSHLLTKTDAGDNVALNSESVIRKNVADLDDIDELVRRQGATLVIVYIPFRRDIPDISRPSASTLKAWSEAHSVSMLDLTAVEAPDPSSQITLDNGIHFNSKGHLVIADAIERSWPEVIRIR
jgi:lysophospholipase L1-like esterase